MKYGNGHQGHYDTATNPYELSTSPARASRQNCPRRSAEGSLDGAKARLGRLRPGEQFAYTFDLGDNWEHLCTVAPQRADPLETLGIIPVGPLPCWGWGDIPDQYGHRWDGDDGSSRMPKAPNGLTDLPPILPGWGPAASPGMARIPGQPVGAQLDGDRY